jgi:hypothetical protein
MHAASITLLCWAVIGAACLFPAAAAVPVGGVLALLVAVVGLPHGAADHRFARPRLEPLLGPVWSVAFLAGYLAIAGLIVLGWFVAPTATILVFFLASAWISVRRSLAWWSARASHDGSSRPSAWPAAAW